MRADDPGPRPANREFHPFWIATAISSALYIGYKFGGYDRASPQPMSSEQPPRPAVTTARPEPVVPPRSPALVMPSAPVAAPPSRQAMPTPAVRRDQPAPSVREIYLCKAYGGGMFWSSATCRSQRATIDRIVNVPASLPWDQQVRIAESQRQEAQALYTSPRPAAATIETTTSSTSGPNECNMLAKQIEHLDAMARQPLPASAQDNIRQQRQQMRSRQAALRC